MDFYLQRIGHQVNNFPSTGFYVWREILSFAENFFVNPLSLQSTSKSGFAGGSRGLSMEPCNPDYYFQNLVNGFYEYVANNGNIIFQDENVEEDKTSKFGMGKKKTRSQQDAMEFLTFLLDRLHEESKAAENALGEDDKDSLKVLKSEARQRIDRIGDEEENEFEEQGSWNTVSNRYKVVVDEKSKEMAVDEISSTIINRLFHGLLR